MPASNTGTPEQRTCSSINHRRGDGVCASALSAPTQGNSYTMGLPCCKSIYHDGRCMLVSRFCCALLFCHDEVALTHGNVFFIV